MKAAFDSSNTKRITFRIKQNFKLEIFITRLTFNIPEVQIQEIECNINHTH
jgi:hypothetical protein